VSPLDPLEPSTPPLPAGITGLARTRRWDASALVSVPELEASSVQEVELLLLADGTIVSTAAVDPEALAALARAVGGGVDPPYVALAVRRSSLEWAVGAATVHAELLAFQSGLGCSSLEVVVTPDGDVTASADGELLSTVPPELEPALGEIERHGRTRFQSFVARADKVGADRWAVTVDPL
jgi:hypothetical protein